MDHYNGTAQTNTDTARTNTGTQKLLYGELSGTILRIFYRVYDRLGFGFLESVYKNALAKEFTREGIPFEREVAIEVLYDGDCIGLFRADFLVDTRSYSK
jgi:hypothetical protein